ncbi:hypothetical protein LPH50_05130 [Xylella taiwanensis]|uniref:Uncharacterized protein n=1 Tax=Xylella taiwanensis TaxID=1444770 RepID=Z9JNT2_9GAMM|nr:hypothetical protein [Xylella taiwanensis]EWS79456.1 hypothetical protein AF72_00790 [Xylella taiwanensis]MCD8455360.1 hypothetical protein [Xylella taiwanensis]MCD8457764.1 hypothetical protein [Xylella taiwanensis]MCD8459899.1 hypothetical protein [Xylella taiwanensis]MCD8464039.1 hypothetical protein [Xylella taiwanensis]
MSLDARRLNTMNPNGTLAINTAHKQHCIGDPNPQSHHPTKPHHRIRDA